MKQGKLFATLMISAFFAGNVMAGQPGINPVKAKNNITHFTMPKNAVEGHDYMPKTVILKVRPEFRSYCSTGKIEHYNLQQYFGVIGAKPVARMFPRHEAPRTVKSASGKPLVDLSLIYEFEYTGSESLEKVINTVLSTGLFQYAEPHYIYWPCYTPNDASYATKQKTNYAKMQIEQAWDVTKGSSSVLIGIIDEGGNTNHEDLKANLWTNTKEIAGNGIDDDANGYIDDTQGWDFGDVDNNTNFDHDSLSHGTHVAGLSAATTDNSKGVAGTGFGCQYVSIKASKKTGGGLGYGFAGIVYGADLGCHIVNCSWGGANGGGYAQDIVNYATINKNCLVIAAAGNDGKDGDFYPAALENVISVGATLASDKKATFSNYAYSVDVMAVGYSIYSCWGNGYYTTQGTSMSSPIAAGVAGLIKAKFPTYTALQIGAQLRATADNIEGTNSALYKGKLGKGRVNAFRAVTETNNIAASIALDSVFDMNDDAITVGDTMRMVVDVTNFLAATTNLTAVLSTTSSAVTVQDGNATYGALATNTSKTNISDPFKVKVNPSALLNEEVTFTVKLTDGTYTESFSFKMQVNVDYMNIEVNEISTTMTSRGLVGYNQGQQVQGKGLSYKSKNTLYEAGLMIGIPNRVSDVVRVASSPTNDNDFKTVTRITEKVPGDYNSAFHGESKFDDSNNPNPLGLEVTHRGFAWNETGHTKYVMVEYAFKNTSGGNLNDLYAGIFVDWDVHDKNTYMKNRCGTDHTNRFGYVYLTDPGGLYAGVKLLSYTAPFNHYAMNLRDTAKIWGISANYFYNDTTKYITMSTSKDTAGGKDPGVDVAGVISSGPFNLAPNETKTIAFALMVGDNLVDLKGTSMNAQNKYNLISGVEQMEAKNTLKLEQSMPNPASNLTTVYFNLPKHSDVELKVINMVGQEVAVLINGERESGWNDVTFDVSKWESGIYYYQLKVGSETITKKMTVVKQ